jgi:hypothetical protein
MMAMMALFLQVVSRDVKKDILVLTVMHAPAQKLRALYSWNLRQFGLEDTSGLEAYLNRSDEDKSLAAMGYVEGADEDGFHFVRTW